MDLHSMPSRAGTDVAAVLFLTRLCGEGFPVQAESPACLLPLGWQSLAEHALDQLHLAGVQEVHLIAADGASQLRRLLGDGERWGMRLRWHLTASGHHPYRILRHLDWGAASHVLLGHADRFVAGWELQVLIGGSGILEVSTELEEGVWSGWSCLPAAVMRGLGSHAPWDTLCDAMMTLRNFFPFTKGQQPEVDGCVLLVDSPLQYLQAQQRWMAAGWLEQAPLSWIRHDWGLQHPGATVGDVSGWQGPVVVGPGCVVQRGVQMTGPVVLSRDVWLGAGSEVSHAVILDRSFVSAGLTLHNCLVGGSHLWRSGVSLQLPSSDAILTQVSDGLPLAVVLERVLGLALAWLLLVPVAPMGLLAWIALRLEGRPVVWHWQSVVLDPEKPTCRSWKWLVCVPPPGPQWARGLLVVCTGFLNIALGLWSWWGLRQRSQAEWDELSSAWQEVLTRGEPGLYSVASDEGDRHEESAEQAVVADLFWVLQLQQSFLRLCFYRLQLVWRKLADRNQRIRATDMRDARAIAVPHQGIAGNEVK